MPAKKKTSKEEPITLIERVNFDLLNRMISSPDMDNDTRIQLSNYRKKIETTDKDGISSINVSYYPSECLEKLEGPNKGRLYADRSLSLQSFSKKIRHPLARDIYYDIDIENSAGRILLQYCEKNNIECTELRSYVRTRDLSLCAIMTLHNVDRSTAKDLMISLCFGGGYVIDGKAPTNPIAFVERFKTEMRNTSNEVSVRYKELRDLVDACPDKPNKPGSTLSIVYQRIENDCLMAMVKFFKERKLIIGTLCFDGALVEKKSVKNIKKLLVDCQKYVKKETGYEILLASKEMNYEPDFTVPEFSKYVNDDKDVVIKLLKIEGRAKFVYCGGQHYFFDETTGMYSSDMSVLNYYLEKNDCFFHSIISKGTENSTEKTISYGRDTTLMNKIPSMIRSSTRDNGWLARNKDSSRGYLLFADGIYNFKEGTFKKGFDPNIVFFERIDYNFPERDEENIKYAMDMSFNQLFDDPSQMIYAISKALSGDPAQKRFYICPGRGSNGKSIFAKMLEATFSGFYASVNSGGLAKTPGNDTKDDAAANRWIFLKRNKRILVTSEPKMQRDFDSAVIKSLTGDDNPEGRIHHGLETNFTPHGIFFVLANDVPAITPLDEAMDDRIKYISFNKKFLNSREMDDLIAKETKKCKGKKEIEECKKKIEMRCRLKDMDIISKISEKKVIVNDDSTDIFAGKFISGFLHIILDGYRYYRTHDEPIFDEEEKARRSSSETITEQIREKLELEYELTGIHRDRVSLAEIKAWKNNNLGKMISNANFESIMTEEFGCSKIKSGEWMWTCIIDKGTYFEREGGSKNNTSSSGKDHLAALHGDGEE